MSYGRNKSNYGHGGHGGGHGGSSNYHGSGSGNYGHQQQHSGYVKEDDNEVLQLFSQCHNSGINFDKYDNIPVQVTPNDPSLRPLQSFQDLSNIHPTLMSNIQRCNYVKPTPVQKYGIPVIFTNKDLMACAQTGSGKTAAFLLVHINNLLLHRQHNDSNRNRGMAYPSILILSPTRELATQIYDESRKFIFQTPIRTSVVYGGADYKNQFRQLEANPEILVATPGRLMDMLERGKLSLSNIKTLVLDEADRMLDMGFEKDIRFILKQSDIPPTGRRQTLMFSATFPKSVQQIASEFLRNYVFLTMGRVGSTSDFITQTLLWVEESQKRFYLLGMLICGISSNYSMGSTLVFVNHKQEAQSLSMFLKNHGIPSNSIHGDRSQDERESALKAFKSGHVGVLVATDVAARGLDIPNVAYVIQYDMAAGIDDYVHRIGRTGRAGNSGHAIAFINDRNKGVCPELLEMLRESNQNIPLWLEGIVKQLGAFNSARQSGEGNFGGQDVREDKSYSNPTKTNQAFDNFNEDAYRGYQWTASDPSSHHQHHQHQQHHPYSRGGRQSRGYGGGGGGGSGRGGRNSATWNDPQIIYKQ